MKKSLELFLIFAKIGAFTFGGGYAILPMLRHEFIEKRHWVDNDEIMDYFAVAQCTPGVIAVNSATLIGRKINGISGGIFATLGVVFPSVVIISLIAMFLKSFAGMPLVSRAFSGIRACVCALILSVISGLFKKSVVDKLTLFIAVAVFLVMIFLKVSPVICVVCAALVGIGTKKWEARK